MPPPLSPLSGASEPQPPVTEPRPAPPPARFGVVAAVRADAPLAVLLLAMVVLGVVLRGYHLADPPSLKWDEHHYVEKARSQLHHQYAWNGHPPLGKLIIAAFMWGLGDRPLAWRLPAFLFGLLNIALGGALAARVFGSLRAAAIAAAFVAVDGFFIAYSRAALLDGMIVAFSLAALLCALNGRTVWHVIAAGFCAGCAVSVKLNGLVFVVVSGAACLASPRLRRSTPLFLLLVALVFYAQYALDQVTVGRSGSLMAVIREHREMVSHHLSFTVRNPWASYWYTWFFPLRPIFLRRDVLSDGSLRVLLTLGNPLLWWGSSVAVVIAAVMIVRAGPRRLWDQFTAARPVGAGLLCWILAAWAGPVVFWIPSLRDAYVYHYLPSYAVALPLLAGFVERLYQRRPLWALLAIVVVAEVSVISLITSDREGLACGMDRPVGSWRCAFSASGEPSDPPPRVGEVLAPYQTVSHAMFLVPALFDQPALAARYQAEPPAGVARNDLRRFVASCQLRLRERVRKLSVRWEREAAWNPANDVWAADVVDCRVEE